MAKKFSDTDTAGRVLARIQEIALEKGLDALSMRDVAKRAGLSLAALQYHFPNKSGLLDAFIDAELEKYRRRIDEIRAASSRDAELEALVRFAIEETLGSERGGVFPMLEARARHDASTAAALDRFMQFYLETMRDVYLRRQPSLSPKLAALAASQVVAMIEGLATVHPVASRLGVTGMALREAVVAAAKRLG